MRPNFDFSFVRTWISHTIPIVKSKDLDFLIPYRGCYSSNQLLTWLKTKNYIKIVLIFFVLTFKKKFNILNLNFFKS